MTISALQMTRRDLSQQSTLIKNAYGNPERAHLWKTITAALLVYLPFGIGLRVTTARGPPRMQFVRSRRRTHVLDCHKFFASIPTLNVSNLDGCRLARWTGAQAGQALCPLICGLEFEKSVDNNNNNSRVDKSMDKGARVADGAHPFNPAPGRGAPATC
uniref:Uncharacterized protein n=1 Tax=Steinernema glaseri TaxID=37863 RepID=A0A1I8ACY6_9BILA